MIPIRTVIKTRMVKIGNSQGIRIPKVVVDQLGLAQDVELEVQAGQLLICPAHQAHTGWDEQFRQMATRGEDHLLDGDEEGCSWA